MKDFDKIIETCPFVFVYGTLKMGHGNWRWTLSSSEYIGPAVTEDSYVLGDVGIPYAFEAETIAEMLDDKFLRPISGDLFKVTDPTIMRKLDVLEGEGVHYHRVLIQVKDHGNAWMYVNRDSTDLYRCYKCSINEEGNWEWP